MKTNLCISFSQQTHNKCILGGSEQDHCYVIAKMLYEKLEILYGEQLNLFIPTRRSGTDAINLRETVQEANAFFKTHGSTGYYLEIHTDAGGYGKGASGLYVSDAGLVFMRDIVGEISKATPWGDIGLVRRTNLHALNATVVPAGIIELSFHDNLEEARWIHETENVVNILVAGLVKSLNLKAVDNNIKALKKIQADIDKINTFLYKNFKNFN